MKNRFLKVGVFTAVVFFSLNTQAQDRKKGGPKGGGSPEKMIERLDTDKDGKLNLEEVSAAKHGKLAENFETIDTNTDGFLDIAELQANKEARKGNKEGSKKGRRKQ